MRGRQEAKSSELLCVLQAFKKLQKVDFSSDQVIICQSASTLDVFLGLSTDTWI